MAGDPFRIFADASTSRQETLRTLWPELYDALARLGGPDESRVIKCPMCAHRYPNEPIPAVGRLTRNGHPACRRCIDQLADRPGGWPLERQEGTP